MAGTEFADVVIPNVLSEGLELKMEVLLGFLPVDGALTTRCRVPRKLGASLKRAELGRHSHSRGTSVFCRRRCEPKASCSNCRPRRRER